MDSGGVRRHAGSANTEADFTMLPDVTLHDAEALLAACRTKGIMLATAESCTGGLIAAALTAIAGSSDVVDRGFVTYSNDAKNQMIGVPMPLIEAHGAVSEAVARAMAEGALARSRAAIAVSVTGVAGPGGGSPEKPIGLVWFGLARSGKPVAAERQVFPGDRTAIRAETVAHAFKMIRAAL
jgi:nicotinamide-nucleotide amidase